MNSPCKASGYLVKVVIHPKPPQPITSTTIPRGSTRPTKPSRRTTRTKRNQVNNAYAYKSMKTRNLATSVTKNIFFFMCNLPELSCSTQYVTYAFGPKKTRCRFVNGQTYIVLINTHNLMNKSVKQRKLPSDWKVLCLRYSEIW